MRPRQGMPTHRNGSRHGRPPARPARRCQRVPQRTATVHESTTAVRRHQGLGPNRATASEIPFPQPWQRHTGSQRHQRRRSGVSRDGSLYAPRLSGTFPGTILLRHGDLTACLPPNDHPDEYWLNRRAVELRMDIAIRCLMEELWVDRKADRGTAPAHRSKVPKPLWSSGRQRFARLPTQRHSDNYTGRSDDGIQIWIDNPMTQCWSYLHLSKIRLNKKHVTASEVDRPALPHDHCVL